MKNVFKDFDKEVNDRNYKRRTFGGKKQTKPTSQNFQEHTSNQTKIIQNPKHKFLKFLKCHHSLHNKNQSLVVVMETSDFLLYTAFPTESECLHTHLCNFGERQVLRCKHFSCPALLHMLWSQDLWGWMCVLIAKANKALENFTKGCTPLVWRNHNFSSVGDISVSDFTC